MIEDQAETLPQALGAAEENGERAEKVPRGYWQEEGSTQVI
jgi:hypothetical protein